MKIFPAIDIKDKKCVRLLKGNFDNKKVYNVAPLDQAKKYKDFGFNYLHIVDLDGALTGETVNLNIIKEIINKLNIKIEIGGGIRSLDKIQNYIDIGADKVILGSAAFKDKNFLKEACRLYKNQIALGLDAKKGFIAISGWKEETNLNALEFLKDVNNFGISRLIYTDIERDGTKTNPNLEETVKVAEISNSPVIVSGGVSSINDIENIKSLNSENIEGAIVGKAIYDGDINLKELSRFLYA
ncbi:MAG TPA: 1-(5-phosphoribosyl)-5-[(5-phosphoribosylamino)methylideneamino]imidazole-4-carboxamide isomerase [Candidatus Pelagibacter bacterium]|jgi:phosphoribosylformimino-5-aminoimidazole carboxamide ribotide isomerase|nr:1-(5-phosphoribosyl)-5-[(5-phosphoribosylamino)methylideneamino]imidazole-4-carboxamide isomerase [Pelagibacteraceae bacterium]HJN84624.1 1-(5-phosphoribosyl)-5-[(5-phosphoribosylamino)methylideneamino]imidazole-4-carboxamide isomerase [Candidatus Pelagibacter bacterium]|tara:strand:- start:1059 stop:1784 length:726 start_codon:yes stop_codon:yes gene_type:complete